MNKSPIEQSNVTLLLTEGIQPAVDVQPAFISSEMPQAFEQPTDAVAEEAVHKHTTGRRFVAAAMAVTAFTGVATMDAQPAEAKSRYVYNEEQGTMKQAMERLKPGDILYIPSGTYNVGALNPKVRKGTPKQPITVQALDKNNPPLFLGNTSLTDANSWKIDSLRFKGTRENSDTFAMAGGKDWTVKNSEFSGANNTHALSNVAIGASTTTPKNWNFSNNCVHDAGTPANPASVSYADQDRYHNIYVNIIKPRGDKSPSNGVMSNNILFNATSGSNVKIGVGDPRLALEGGSDIKIVNNTAYSARHQFMIAGNVTRILFKKNLMTHSIDKRMPNGIYLNYLTHGTSKRDNAVLIDNYAGRITKTPNDMVSPVSFTKPEHIKDMNTYKGTVKIDKPSLEVRGNPKLTQDGCNGSMPTNPAAKGYGAKR